LEFDITSIVDMPNYDTEPEDDIEKSCQILIIKLDIEELTLNM